MTKTIQTKPRRILLAVQAVVDGRHCGRWCPRRHDCWLLPNDWNGSILDTRARTNSCLAAERRMNKALHEEGMIARHSGWPPLANHTKAKPKRHK